jgi:hypothetical protein
VAGVDRQEFLTTTALDLVVVADHRLTLARREPGWTVHHAREAGFSWAQIGQALGGVTAQVAHKRFAGIADKRHYVNNHFVSSYHCPRCEPGSTTLGDRRKAIE